MAKLQTSRMSSAISAARGQCEPRHMGKHPSWIMRSLCPRTWPPTQVDLRSESWPHLSIPGKLANIVVHVYNTYTFSKKDNKGRNHARHTLYCMVRQTSYQNYRRQYTYGMYSSVQGQLKCAKSIRVITVCLTQRLSVPSIAFWKYWHNHKLAAVSKSTLIVCNTMTMNNCNLIQAVWICYIFKVPSTCIHTPTWIGKERNIAPFILWIVSKCSGIDHTVLPSNNTMPAFPS